MSAGSEEFVVFVVMGLASLRPHNRFGATTPRADGKFLTSLTLFVSSIGNGQKGDARRRQTDLPSRNTFTRDHRELVVGGQGQLMSVQLAPGVVELHRR